jgi:hypothetical protein
VHRKNFRATEVLNNYIIFNGIVNMQQPVSRARGRKYDLQLLLEVIFRGGREVKEINKLVASKGGCNITLTCAVSEPSRLIQAAKQLGTRWPLKWELLFRMALCTGMRRGELLNTTWKDIDFEHKSVDVSPKKDAEYMWEWHIKDTDRRTLPLTDELVRLLAEHQATQPEKHPYLFIPADRYDYIQRLRNDGKWSVQLGCCPVNNFDRQFKVVLKTAGIENGGFHDLRRTCLTNWFANGLNEHDVMTMAGHANFETTRRFYLAVCDDLLERTRQASSKTMADISVANLLQVPFQTKE